MVIFHLGGYLAGLLDRLGGQHPKTIFSLIFGPLATNEETPFLKFQKNFFHYTLTSNTFYLYIFQNFQIFACWLFRNFFFKTRCSEIKVKK